MNTYIIHLTNKPGYEWVSHHGETEVVEATSLQDALDTIIHLESVWNDMYEELEQDANASFKEEDLIPLNISVTEIPGVGKGVAQKDIKQTLQQMINTQRSSLLADVIQQQQLDQQKMADVARVKAEMNRLGIKPEDLK